MAYDANGNIMKYLRNSISGTTADMDSLSYKYYANTNQLKQIVDRVPDNTYISKEDNLVADIDNQPDNNYAYDPIGNLIKDSAEKISSIKWNVYGKIQEINKSATTLAPATKIQYTYDALGNRISQVVTTSDTKSYTWYVRDAQGNLLSTYTANGNATDLADLEVNQSERFLYGSSRLGVLTASNSVDGGPDDMQYKEAANFGRGYKQYELTNHLGNACPSVTQ